MIPSYPTRKEIVSLIWILLPISMIIMWSLTPPSSLYTLSRVSVILFLVSAAPAISIWILAAALALLTTRSYQRLAITALPIGILIVASIVTLPTMNTLPVVIQLMFATLLWGGIFEIILGLIVRLAHSPNALHTARIRRDWES